MRENVVDRPEHQHDQTECGIGGVEIGPVDDGRTRLLRPSCRALLIPSRTAAKMPSRRLRIVLAAVMNGFSPLRDAFEQKRSSNMVTSASERSPVDTA